MRRALSRARRSPPPSSFCVVRALHTALGDIGQPTHETHPHLLSADQVTPGISRAEFASRRSAFLSTLPVGAVALLLSSPPLTFPGTVIPAPHVYRQDGDMQYLTGVTQPGCAALFTKHSGQSRFTLFAPPHSPHELTWNGPRLGPSALVSHFGADEGLSTAEFGDCVGSALSLASKVYLDVEKLRTAAPADSLQAELGRLLGRFAAQRPSPLQPLLAPLRWRKSEAEVNLMRRSAQAACEGLRAAAGAAVVGATEAAPAGAHELSVRAVSGACRLPYPSVVAGGVRGAAIHYGRYDGVFAEGDTLLMDAGAELHGYVSDVTRVWPVSDSGFSARQRALYEAVREAHAEGVAGVHPGACLAELHAASVGSLSRALVQLGVLAGTAAGLSAEQVASSGAYHAFYPTALGHYLGLDTHDTPAVPLSAPLEPNVVLTIEPGLYLRWDDARVKPQWRGMAVRIEDDVLVTRQGCEVLSCGAPVEVEQVEEWARAAREAARGRRRA